MLPFERWIALALIVLSALASFAAAWHVRGLQSDAEIARLKIGELNETILQQQVAQNKASEAISAAKDFAEKTAKLQPIILRIKDNAAPEIRILDTCPLRVDAWRLLDAAADAADAARNTGVPSRASPILPHSAP